MSQSTNSYESAAQKVIPAVLLYAFYDDELLMIHKKDYWNGLGGKLNKGESGIEAAIREFHEEAGLKTQIADWKWLGQLYFPDFKSHKHEDWWVTVFVAQLSFEQRKKIKTDVQTAEGTLHWVPQSNILDLNLWEGDSDFLPYVFKKIPFEGTLFYSNGKCIRKKVSSISI
ncbi:MAG: NUDIX domain-containing protein [Bdellovibrionales bacterium]|nr:NUDIX domain-containing protein [Bdellovibrionales bacterium]